MLQSLVKKLLVTTCFLVIAFVPRLSGLDMDFYNAQRRLIERLTNKSGVTKEILPAVNRNTPVTLKVGLSIRQIAKVDEVNQALRLNVWLRLYWNNAFLKWNPEDYDHITSVHLGNERLWKPDIAMYNKASLEEEIDILYKRMSTQIIVKYDGNCSWLSPVTLLSQCKINVAKFPFDEQLCPVTLGSWTYSLRKIDVVPGEVQLENFLPNGDWDILGSPLTRLVKNYTGVDRYPEVTLNLHIKRRPLYYTLNLILPCTVISVLAFLSFVLPTNHGERVSLVITVLLAMSVYMLIVSGTLPRTSDGIPVIGIYFLCIIVEIALCLLATCLVAKLREHETEIPRWLDTLVNKRLARLLLVSHVTHEYDLHAESSNGYTKTARLKLKEVKISENHETAEEKGASKLSEELAVLAEDVSKRQKREVLMRKWQNAAKVLDRFFLFLFPFIFVIITASVFS